MQHTREMLKAYLTDTPQPGTSADNEMDAPLANETACIEQQGPTCSYLPSEVTATTDDASESPIGIDPICNDQQPATIDSDSPSEATVTTTAAEDTQQPEITPQTPTPLEKYSLLGHSGTMENSLIEQVFVMDKMAILGQSTVFYAQPNTGKTLLSIHMLVASLKAKLLNPANVYYINVDDSATGLLEKLHIAEEYQFHMLAEGFRGFKARKFLTTMEEMIENNSCRGVVTILDTMKRFTDMMSKQASSAFTETVRAFVMKGGTLIALAHTNKNRRASGELVHAGTSDVLDDFDCAYIVDTVNSDEDSNVKTVEFKRLKARGNSASSVGFSYSIEKDLSYNELVLSVQKVSEDNIKAIKEAEVKKPATDISIAIIQCIDAGINTKMELATAAAKLLNVSKRTVLKILENYCGPGTGNFWDYTVKERGAKVFFVHSHTKELLSYPGP